MPKNAPLKTLVHRDLTIEGYSRAAVQTYWRIPELKLGFDLGAQPWEFMGTPTWFVSHTHLDHVAALPVYVARRRMMKMDPPVIYLPAHAVDTVHQLLQLVSRLDRGRLPCELVGVQARRRNCDCRGRLVVTAHATAHTVPSLGYIVWERRKKLKAEYRDLRGDQIRDIRLAGTEVSEETRLPRLAYLGDSRPAGLDDNPDMYRAEMLIAEMTFVAPSHRKDKIHKHGHMHLDDIVQRRDRFQNEQIIFCAFQHPLPCAADPSSSWRKLLPDLLGGRAASVAVSGPTPVIGSDAHARPSPRRLRPCSVLPAPLRVLQFQRHRRPRGPAGELICRRLSCELSALPCPCPLDTLYVGGGTPTELEPPFLRPLVRPAAGPIPSGPRLRMDGGSQPDRTKPAHIELLRALRGPIASVWESSRFRMANCRFWNATTAPPTSAASILWYGTPSLRCRWT